MKYIKYKEKYLKFKKGGGLENITINEFSKMVCEVNVDDVTDEEKLKIILEYYNKIYLLKDDKEKQLFLIDCFFKLKDYSEDEQFNCFLNFCSIFGELNIKHALEGMLDEYDEKMYVEKKRYLEAMKNSDKKTIETMKTLYKKLSDEEVRKNIREMLEEKERQVKLIRQDEKKIKESYLYIIRINETEDKKMLKEIMERTLKPIQDRLNIEQTNLLKIKELNLNLQLAKKALISDGIYVDLMGDNIIKIREEIFELEKNHAKSVIITLPELIKMRDFLLIQCETS
jgi:hypothetical protein